MKYPILVLGGYGNFGGKISEKLAKHSGIRVIVAGRDKQKAEDFARIMSHETGSTIDAVKLDISESNLCKNIADTGEKLVIHSCGPFQGQSYSVAEACIESGINYIDLADGRSFVNGFEKLNIKAKQNNVLAVTGASSVPGLSSSVVDEFLSAFRELKEIEYGIAPGNQADRGEATVKAILSYTGRPFKRWQGGSWDDVYGWQEVHKQTFPCPIGKRWLANCDIPDLELFHSRYPGLRTIKFYAGLEIGALHIGLWLLSWSARFRLVSNLSRYSRIITKMSCWVQTLGTDIGGMYIQMSGTDVNGNPKVLRWDLVAEDGDGPKIPTIPSIILAKKLAEGTLEEKGAKACVGLFSLAEFTDEVEDLNIWQKLTSVP
ncbi:saccharopine dehydrogenase NADP-binding domain-containing protein [Gilvimarinus sp. SDUM040013]|uniref:Saccharopine dehydrogenase NADP-binding domain-containing protein n=1 Tax=Gilvimarinus gilvus TaxID=3058038 RepID=A0ABU4RXK0_9GAMM|nr:saccharopine dehydrogenase NADP-binding domain-containing protein [Gilvimarinus sp. SDUM040013]MDO3386374.1 saccharopine dehydrogenase NADP-binding domain-containing protein [Gilvimarinus sp. SDUM040013]MDX6849640.1 saccharopine dehydrogenase NADP-binding domain-containing protein [Gilvimarinus sp. SDUM040013]